jgi:hypothetical protein
LARSPKLPPPDTVANVLGRIGQLKMTARQNAAMEAREGADKMHALGKHVKAIEPDLKKLQRRLEKARKAEGSRPSAKESEIPAKKPRRVEPAKEAEVAEVDGESDDDFLAKLDAL